MVVLMVLGFLFAWVPYASFAAWIFLNRGAAFSAQSMAIPAFFSKTSALFNPIIYVLLNKQVSNVILQHVSKVMFSQHIPHLKSKKKFKVLKYVDVV